jgi:hypothetical protein
MSRKSLGVGLAWVEPSVIERTVKTAVLMDLVGIRITLRFGGVLP